MVVQDARDRGISSVGSARGPVIIFDGNGDIWHLVAYKAVAWAETACREFGIAVAGMKDIRRFATPGTVARRAATKGMIALIFEYGGKAFMAPYGGCDAVMSTNPVGIGIPTPHEPIILDMASSERAFFFISLAQKLGRDIPSTWGVDTDGKSTTDPSQVKTILPFGGYKGYGIAFMLEILSGVLLGVDVGLSGDLSKRGALCFFLSPSLFGVSIDEFNSRVQQFIADVKSSRLAEGHEHIFIPGEQAENKRKACMAEGALELDEETYRTLTSL
jgi:LDH2 family malate/lactate/ureidoglycolate dehydrogenase